MFCLSVGFQASTRKGLRLPHVAAVMNIDIWSDVVCPWCYLGKKHFEHALESFDDHDDLVVVYRSFELDPGAERDVTTPTRDRLASKYGMSIAEADAAQRQMEQRAAAAGLEFNLTDLRSGSTYDAHRLLQFARERGLQPELLERLHRAYFTEQRSIFDAESLTALAAEVGLDSDEVRGVLVGEDFATDVVEDEQTARSIGVTGVPFFVIDQRFAVSGAQPAEIIVQALEHAQNEAARRTG
jgi:predicted DsbA family dithiol-disulfide isomerase